MESREHAENLVRYFERIIREYGDGEVWQKGLKTAQDWLRLIDTENLSEKELSTFTRVVHANRYRTSGWHDLALGSYFWAVSKGAKLPPPQEFFAPENLPSKNFKPVNPVEHSLILVTHFEQYHLDDPENLAWSLGLQTAKEWQKLLDMPSITEADVSLLVELLSNHKKYSSAGWFDITLGVSKWLKSCGFDELIPQDYLHLAQ
jgi:hypothetical protein